MKPPALTTLHFRDAVLEDLEALTAIKSCEAVHHDRIIDARSSSFSYLVVERNRQVVGFACLVFTRPASWSDSHDTNHLPQIVDIQINPTLRGQGFGSFLIRGLEALATEKGCEQIYLAVDPVNNPRAHTLY